PTVCPQAPTKCPPTPTRCVICQPTRDASGAAKPTVCPAGTACPVKPTQSVEQNCPVPVGE
ncbi:MAG: hypothetical protein QME49_04135, partial [bacterium]|nr:hypothetical protein [bacterium]